MWVNKIRTILVTLSIMIGVLGVGVIGQAKYSLTKGMQNNFQTSNPANVTILSEPFDENILPKIRSIQGVEEVETRNTLYGRMKVATGVKVESEEAEWSRLQLFSVRSFQDIHLNRLFLEKGSWPSSENEVVLERTTFDFYQLKIGNYIWIEVPSGQKKRFEIAGVVWDPLRETTKISGISFAYMAMDTIGVFPLR